MTDDDLKALVASLAISQKENTAQQKETDALQKETTRKLDKVAKMLGGMGNNQGDVAEEFFYNSMKAKPTLEITKGVGVII